MTWKALLSQHIGHTLVVGQKDTAWCETCRVQLDFFPASPFPNVNDPSRCLVHWDTPPCRGCAADRKALP